jgi:hypothetical protein
MSEGKAHPFFCRFAVLYEQGYESIDASDPAVATENLKPQKKRP